MPLRDENVVTISFAGYNRAWASWIAERLEQHGLRVVLQRWDVTAGGSVQQGLDDLLLSEGRVLMVLSEWYFRLGNRSQEEWNEALRVTLPRDSERFAAVAVTPGPLPVADMLDAAELWGQDAAEAERRLLSRLGVTSAPDPDASPGRGRSRFPLDRPAVWGGVPRRNPRFTGREALLAQLYEELSQAEPGAGVVTLLGLSGVGKTHIATEYVYRFGPEYDVVWWARAAERGTLREKLAGLAPALGLVTGREYGERLRAVRDALRRGDPYFRWLLVLDGADQPEDVHDLVPTGPGHVLITSQNRDWGEHNSALIEVPVYDRDESVAFVRRRAPRLDDADANRLAEALGDLALALDQNAGALNDSTMPVDEYLELLRHGTDAEPGLTVAADFQMTYYTAFSILLNRLREDNPEAVDLLRLCVFFAPGPLPVRMLRDTPIPDMPRQLSGLMSDPLLWEAAIGKLNQWSVVQSDPGQAGSADAGSTEVIQMHRLVYQAVRNDMREEERAVYSRAVRGILAAADPGRPTDARLWPRYAEIVPHLEASRSLRSTDPQVQATVLNCLRYLYLSGEYRSGVQIAETVAEEWGDRPLPDDSRWWDLIHHRANLLRATGDYSATERLDRVALERLQAAGPESEWAALRAAGDLAADLRSLGKYQEALELAEFARDGYAELFGPDDSRTLSAQNNIAVSYRLLGRYSDALQLDQETMEARRSLLRDRHNWTLSSENSFAHDLRLLGRYEQATSVQERNSEAHRSVLGADHPQTLRADHNLALCYYRSGDQPRAGDLLARLLERSERVLGAGEPLTVGISVSLAGFEREHGDLDRARDLCEVALRTYRLTLSPGHPYNAGTLANHGLVQAAVGEFGQALGELEEALDSMTRAVGAEHPWTLGCALNVAGLRRRLSYTGTAADLSRGTAEKAAARLGARHPLTLACRIEQAAGLRNLRRLGEADDIEKKALSDLAETLGSRHPQTVAARARTQPYWDFEPFST
ncbi:FxSxx-COOH system tetratricopeptide repeat protein [Streptomyces sp. CA-111067]|uniref:FxSxx-COOH system tetratricopeptide repeat protein n=1 Tax=Streptomyces sp. CA-111067 TaxID=3240046 RepID=UPI003D9942A6